MQTADQLRCKEVAVVVAAVELRAEGVNAIAVVSTAIDGTEVTLLAVRPCYDVVEYLAELGNGVLNLTRDSRRVATELL